MFDPNTYDPFAGYGGNREIHQRINSTIRKAADNLGDRVIGPALVLWPDDWALIDQMAENIGKTDLVQTRNHDMRTLAASTVEDHLTHRDELADSPDGRYVVFGFDPSVAFPIDDVYDTKELVNRHLPAKYRLCDVQSDRLCTKDDAALVLQLFYGDAILIYKTCDTCLKWFDNPNRKFRHNQGFGLSFAAMAGDDRHPATQ